MSAVPAQTLAEQMVIALDMTAWRVGTAEGRVPGVGYVNVDRATGARRRYRLNGKKSTARAIYELARRAKPPARTALRALCEAGYAPVSELVACGGGR